MQRTELLTMVDVTGVVQRTASGVYAAIGRREFPRPIKVGVRSYWRASDIERYLQGRADDVEARREELHRAARERRWA